jgi:methionine-S-sulfoxide reductase
VAFPPEACSSGQTGHVEVLNVELKDPIPELFEELVNFFFTFHDPTTLDRQGNDAGTQYASIIFCSDAQQTTIANKVKKEELQHDKKRVTAYSTPQIHTAGVVDYTDFYPAQDDHQEYSSFPIKRTA